MQGLMLAVSKLGLTCCDRVEDQSSCETNEVVIGETIRAEPGCYGGYVIAQLPRRAGCAGTVTKHTKGGGLATLVDVQEGYLAEDGG